MKNRKDVIIQEPLLAIAVMNDVEEVVYPCTMQSCWLIVENLLLVRPEISVLQESTKP